jgi:hypothetical protein
MEKFARSGTGDASGSALLDRKEAGISGQSYYRWRKECGTHQKGSEILTATVAPRVELVHAYP